LFAVDRSPRLRAVVCRQLRAGWSPASIAGRLPTEYAADESCRVSHEAIYQWVYAQPVSTLARELISLRTGRTTRRGGRRPVGAENSVTSCDLHVLVQKATETVASQRTNSRCGRRGSAAGGRLLIERSVGAVRVVVPDVLPKHCREVTCTRVGRPQREIMLRGRWMVTARSAGSERAGQRPCHGSRHRQAHGRWSRSCSSPAGERGSCPRRPRRRGHGQPRRRPAGVAAVSPKS